MDDKVFDVFNEALSMAAKRECVGCVITLIAKAGKEVSNISPAKDIIYVWYSDLPNVIKTNSYLPLIIDDELNHNDEELEDD